MRPTLEGYSTPQYGHGIYIPHLDLWLDASHPQGFSVLSHAHGDHLGHHETTVATPETARLAKLRGISGPVLELAYGEVWEEPGRRYTLQLFPAGHILGAAQVLITEPNGRRTVYTGDFKLREPLFGPEAPVVACDVLIMEATFGQPQYRFPHDEVLVKHLHAVCRNALAAGVTPIVFAYTLGKAQQALRYLLDGGFSVSVHGAIANMCTAYEELGASFEGDWERYERNRLEGRVLLAPTQTSRSKMVRNVLRRRTIYLSGWGLDPRSKWRFGVDVVIPFSDHADWDDLLRYVRGAEPQKVYTVHGFPDLSVHLRGQGIDALHLETHQLSMM